MSIKLKKTLCFGLATLLVASVGASASNVNVNAKHARTHRVYRHHHKVNRKKIQRIRQRNVRHRRNKKTRYAKRTRHASHKRPRKRRAKKAAKKSRKRGFGMSLVGQSTYPIKPSLMDSIKTNAKQSGKLYNIPKQYYGNFFIKNIDNIKNHDAFFHLAKYGSYVLSDPETDQSPYYAHPMGEGDMSLPGTYTSYGYGFSFLNAKIPPTNLKYNKSTNKLVFFEDDGNAHPMTKLQSEKQGIYLFQTENHNYRDYDE